MELMGLQAGKKELLTVLITMRIKAGMQMLVII
jgi:hypothetical protein